MRIADIEHSEHSDIVSLSRHCVQRRIDTVQSPKWNYRRHTVPPADDGETVQLLHGRRRGLGARLRLPELRRDADGDQVDDEGSYREGKVGH